MGTRKYPIVQIVCFVALLLFFQTGKAQDKEQTPIKGQAQFIVDAHVHVGLVKLDNRITPSGLNYFTDRNINAFVFALPVDRSKTDNLMLRIIEEIELIHNVVGKKEDLKVIDDLDGSDFQADEEKTSILFSIEFFGGIFGKNIKSIESFKEHGIRYITLTSNTEDNLFTPTGKLTEFGELVIKKMNEVDLLIDISHLSELQMLEIIRNSKKPVIASHSAVRVVTNTKNNLSDTVLNALKQNDGYVMITFNKADLLDKHDIQNNGVEQFVRHIDHVNKFVGISHIGIGSDFQAAGKYIPEELNQNDVFTKISETMKLFGYSASEISGVLGNNLKQLF